MKASETKFQQIIEGAKQYVVPLFQRPYSWKKEEWAVLWDDLIWLCGNEEPKSHFVGSMVTMPTHSVPEGVAKYLLIDGQQRLTTIFILLTLLRNTANAQDNTRLAQQIEQTMLTNHFNEGNDYFKLLPTQVDRAAFSSLIHGETVDPDSKLWQCYQFFERKLKQSKVGIVTIHKIITTRLSAVSIVLENDDNPHLVFESLNAKGRPLTQSDLIRNYFFMRIHVSEQESIHALYWKPMETALDENLTECIRHYLMRDGAIVKQGDVYFTLKDRIGQGDALTALKEIATYAGYYQKLLAPEKEGHVPLRAALTQLNRLEVTTAYPFLLNCYHEYVQGQISADDFLEILDIIENFVIRRFVCNVPTNAFNKIFPSMYNQAKSRVLSSLAEGVREILQTRNYPKDSEFRTRLIDSRLYGAGERLIKTKLILETLEAAHQHKESTPFDNLTIEHIMPQTPTAWWQSHLGEQWQTDFDFCLHTLGNLTLTAYNSELSNASFPEKKQQFANSHLELNRYFEGRESWNREAIEARSNALAEAALGIWPYFGSEQIAATVSEPVTGTVPNTVTILGQQFAADSWVSVLAQTFQTIAELEPDLFVVLAEKYPRFLSKDANKFKRCRDMKNGYYLDVNFSAKDIHRFCTQAIEAIGLSSEDWFVGVE